MFLKCVKYKYYDTIDTALNVVAQDKNRLACTESWLVASLNYSAEP